MNILIYSKENCRYCNEAKALLKSRDIDYVEVKCSTTENMTHIRECYPEARTFPVIIIDGEWIGGFTQLNELVKNIPKVDDVVS